VGCLHVEYVCIARSKPVGAERYEIGVGPTGYILV